MSVERMPQQLLTSYEKVSEQGRRYDEEDSPTGCYYGFLVELERVQYKEGGPITYSAQFEIAPSEWLQTVVFTMPRVGTYPPPDAPYTLLVFEEAPLDHLANALSTTTENLNEGEWFLLHLDGGLDAQRAKPAYPVKPVPVKVSGEPVPDSDGEKLKKRYRPTGRFSYSLLRGLFGPKKKMEAVDVPGAPLEVGVMDVGQASCNLVYDPPGTPCFYVDVGLPMFFNYASLPPAGPAGVVEVIEVLTEKIRAYDGRIQQWGEQRYPQSQRLSQVHGVGPLTALA
ncbi:MAG: hypothetical protein ACMUHX_05120, partial [bacterium]